MSMSDVLNSLWVLKKMILIVVFFTRGMKGFEVYFDEYEPGKTSTFLVKREARRCLLIRNLIFYVDLGFGGTRCNIEELLLYFIFYGDLGGIRWINQIEPNGLFEYDYDSFEWYLRRGYHRRVEIEGLFDFNLILETHLKTNLFSCIMLDDEDLWFQESHSGASQQWFLKKFRENFGEKKGYIRWTETWTAINYLEYYLTYRDFCEGGEKNDFSGVKK